MTIEVTKAEWVERGQRPAINITKRIQPTPEPNRITLDVPPRLRVVIPEVVVVSLFVYFYFCMNYFPHAIDLLQVYKNDAIILTSGHVQI